jgi:hypothetical protein
VVLSISPNTGPTIGGTIVTIRGLRFTAGAAVTIGGQGATDVNVQDGEVITAKTPPAAGASAVDVIVTLDGKSAALPAGFTYEAPANSPPVITSLTARGERPGQPANFADRGETMQIVASLEDAETPPAQLTYEWTACGGAFSGAGAEVSWRAPDEVPEPRTCAIELTVVDGAHRVSASLTVRVHDSVAEIRDLTLEFLDDFANSSMRAETVVRHFSDSCPGKHDELEDVRDNRETYTSIESAVDTPSVSVGFGGVCPFGNRQADACVATQVEWRSTKADESEEIAIGTSHITAIYESSEWWLCDSLFEGTSTSTLGFMR